MKPFRELSRRARLVRLRHLANTALDAYGLGDAHLGFIQYGENIIYRVDVPGEGAGKEVNSPYLPNRYLLRIHAMGDEDAIASELTWLAALNREARLPVPAPVPTPDGNLLTRITTPGMPNGRVVSLMRWLDGRKLLKGMRPKHLSSLGEVIAKMHTFSANWQPPAGFSRPTWDWAGQLGGKEFSVPLEELVDSMPLIYKEPFLEVSRQAKRVMKSMGKGSDAFGLIHADLYPENVLYKAGKALVIDFEDCGHGYWMWDIAVALCQWAWNADWERMRDAFKDGYARVRTLPEKQWDQLDLFVATQFATMVLWASMFLKHDPKRVDEYTPWRDKNGEKLLRFFEHKGIG